MAGDRLPSTNSLTHRDLVRFLDPAALDSLDHLKWPPNAFALAAYLLAATGGYRDVLSSWPPKQKPFDDVKAKWTSWVTKYAKQWRGSAESGRAAPTKIKQIWNAAKDHFGLAMTVQRDTPARRTNIRELNQCLIAIVALADAASSGVGIPRLQDKVPQYEWKAINLLRDEGASLATNVVREKLRVLPKLHTPRSGLTLRSLTHHLALHVGNEVVPYWYNIPQITDDRLNLLLAPWPLSIQPKNFAPAHGQEALKTRHRTMDLRLAANPTRVAVWIEALLKASEQRVHKVHGVVFPESSLSESEYEAVLAVLRRRDMILIAGVAAPATSPTDVGLNGVHLWSQSNGMEFDVYQSKHHRWRLDRSQVEMYGLASFLDPRNEWWENISTPPREIHFAALNSGIALCCLICEDLARLDPVSSLVRSVGPNLLIALLADGPQIEKRWSARYATVLAEDPGCAVLTLSSLGMVRLSRPRKGEKASNAIALWKDSESATTEIDLPDGCDAALLTLCSDEVEEFSADGRSDGEVTDQLKLVGTHYLKSGLAAE